MATEQPSCVQRHVAMIEDDEVVAGAVMDGLKAHGYTVHHVTTVAAGRRLLGSGPFDVVILDLTLPDGSGLDLARELRRSGNQTPILMLTARNDPGERIEGFQHGADDYLGKPFVFEELLLRLKAILRRTEAATGHVLKYADVELDLVTRTARRQSITATLSARETALLAYMLRRPEETLGRDEILDHVWGDEAESDSNVLNVYVNYLRNKIEAGRYPRLIHTVRGAGYMLSATEPDATPSRQHV